MLLNWRDPWHPKAGGAEIVTHRILERLANKGWYVEWFSARYSGSNEYEIRDGIKFVRGGSEATVHLAAFARYGVRHSGSFSVAVDQINTVPFFTPGYIKCPIVAFVHQLAREVWLYEAPAVVGAIGYSLEPLYLQAYRNTPIVTVSESTRESLIEIGMRGNIHVIPEAVDDRPEETVPAKLMPPNVAVVCRMTPSKRVDLAIRAAAMLRNSGWDGALHLVGRGDASYMAHLKTLGNRLLGEGCQIHGRVSYEERSRIMRESSVLWLSSLREGWGLVVTEAACYGTPAVVSNVPGLRDAVKHGITGLVVSPEPSCFAEATLAILGDYVRYSGNALEDSRQYNWDLTAREFEKVLLRYSL